MNLPLTDNPEEKFNISIDSIIYIMRQIWNEYGFWTLDIQDANGNDLVLGVKLVTQLRLLEQYPHMPFDLYSSSDSDPTRYGLNSFALEVIDRV